MANNINKKIKSLPTNDLLNMYEKWFREHDEELRSFFKVLDPKAKATQLTFDSKFHNLIKRMSEDDNDCLILKALLGDNHLKVKSSYLANNNINALSLEKDEKGEFCVGYRDVKQNLTREFFFMKNWEGKKLLVERILGIKEFMNSHFKIVKDGTKEVKFHTLMSGEQTSLNFSNNLVKLKDIYGSVSNDFLYKSIEDKISNNNITPILFGYLSNLSNTENFVSRVLYAVYNIFRHSGYVLTKKGNSASYYYPDVKERKRYEKAFEQIFLENDRIYKMVDTILFFYNKQIDFMLKILNEIHTYKNLDELLKVITESNEDLLINMLAVLEDFIELNNKLYEADQTITPIISKGGGLGRKISQVFTTLNITRYDYSLAVKALLIEDYFRSDICMNDDYKPIGFKYTLNSDIHNFTKNLFSTTSREQAKIGKLSSKLFNSHYKATEIEVLTNLFKKNVEQENIPYSFKEVSGDLITYYYNRNTYTLLKGCPINRRTQNPMDNVIINMPEETTLVDGNGGSLYNSCMRSPSNYDEIKLYAENPNSIKMIVGFDSDTRVAARAILWVGINGNKYIDRVYAVNEKIRLALYAYAESKGYISINGTNTSYNKKLKIGTMGGNVVVLEKIPKRIPFFDSVHIIQNSDHRLIEVGNASVLQKNKGMKRVAEFDKEKAAAKEVNKIDPIDVTIKSADAKYKNAIKNYGRKKSFELSKEYDFEVSIGSKKLDEPRKTKFRTLKQPNDLEVIYVEQANNLLNQMLYGIPSKGKHHIDVLKDEVEYEHRLQFRIKGNKPAPTIPMWPRVVKPENNKAWVEQKVKTKINLMQFLGSPNYMRAA